MDRSTETTLSTVISLLETQVVTEGLGIGTFMEIEEAFSNTAGATIEGTLRRCEKMSNSFIGGPKQLRSPNVGFQLEADGYKSIHRVKYYQRFHETKY